MLLRNSELIKILKTKVLLKHTMKKLIQLYIWTIKKPERLFTTFLKMILQKLLMLITKCLRILEVQTREMIKQKLRFRHLQRNCLDLWHSIPLEPMITSSGYSSTRTIHSLWLRSRWQQRLQWLFILFSLSFILNRFSKVLCLTMEVTLSTLSDLLLLCFYICKCIHRSIKQDRCLLSWSIILKDLLVIYLFGQP
jgi:hypothetical protein